MKIEQYRLPVALLMAIGLFSASASAQEPVPSASPTDTPTPKVSPASPKPESTAPPAPLKPIADTQKRLERSVTLTDGSRIVKLPRRELGFTLVSDAPVQFAIDKAVLKKRLDSAASVFHAEAVNARPFIYKGHFAIDPGAYARSLNVPTTAEKIIQEVAAAPGTMIFRVALDKKPPQVSQEKLQGISGKLSQFSSIASGTADRDNNIAVAVNSINGTLLSPGEVFSLNNTVGERTKARGFKEAHVFVDAKIVNGVGGGVSQVTGTLFNAAALGDLKIVEVNPHSRPVAYLPLGRDATVAFGAKDLKFKNNTDAPIYITYTFIDKRLTATLWGKPTPGRTVSLHPTVQRRGPGKINAQLYRITREQGKIVAKERLVNHAYRWKPEED